MTDYVSTAVSNLLTGLRDNVEDPIHRTDKNWIYYGAYEENAKTPRVYFIWDKEFPGKMHIGSTVQPMNVVIRMYILVRGGIKGTINSVEYSGSELLNRVWDQVMNYIETNSTSITGITSITRASTPRLGFDFDPDSKMYFSRTYFNLFIWRS